MKAWFNAAKILGILCAIALFCAACSNSIPDSTQEEGETTPNKADAEKDDAAQRENLNDDDGDMGAENGEPLDIAGLTVAEGFADTPRPKIYSPNGENYFTYSYIYTNSGDASDELFKAFIFLNESTKPIAEPDYPWFMTDSHVSMSFWLDDENILMEAAQIYNISEGVISMPQVQALGGSQGEEYNKISYAPNEAGDRIAYLMMLDAEDNHQTWRLYIYDRTNEQLDFACEIVSDKWFSVWTAGLVWSGDSIYFNCVTLADDTADGIGNEKKEIMKFDTQSKVLSILSQGYSIEKISPSQRYCYMTGRYDMSSFFYDLENEEALFSINKAPHIYFAWSDVDDSIAYVCDGEIIIHDLRSNQEISRIDISQVEESEKAVHNIYCSDGVFYVKIIDNETDMDRLYILEG